MLKTTIFAVCFIIYCQAKLLGKHKQEINEISANCKQKEGVTPEQYEKFKSGAVPADDKIKAVVICISKEVGAMDDNGKLIKPTIKDLIHGKLPDEATEEKFMTECVVDQATPGDTALYIRACSKKYFKNMTT